MEINKRKFLTTIVFIILVLFVFSSELLATECDQPCYSRDSSGNCTILCDDDPDQTCCGGVCIDTTTQGCCDGVPYDLATEECCGETVIYICDPNTCYDCNDVLSECEYRCEDPNYPVCDGEGNCVECVEDGSCESCEKCIGNGCVPVTLVSLIPDGLTSFDDGDGDPNTTSYSVCVASAGTVVTVTATFSEPNAVPPCSLSGGMETGNELTREVDISTPGVKTVSAGCCGFSKTANIYVVEVASLSIDKGSMFDDEDGNSNTLACVVERYFCDWLADPNDPNVPADPNTVDYATVTITPYPPCPEGVDPDAYLPPCWEVIGGSGSNLERRVDISQAGMKTVSATCGVSQKTLKIYILEMTDLVPSEGTEVDDGDGDPNTKVYWVDYDPNGGTVYIRAQFNPTGPLDDPNDFVSACSHWELTPETAGSDIYKTLEKDVPGVYTVTGHYRSSFSVKFYVVRSLLGIAADKGDGYPDGDKYGHAWWGLAFNALCEFFILL